MHFVRDWGVVIIMLSDENEHMSLLFKRNYWEMSNIDYISHKEREQNWIDVCHICHCETNKYWKSRRSFCPFFMYIY